MSVNIYTAAGLKKLAGSGFMDAELNENSNNGVKNSVVTKKIKSAGVVGSMTIFAGSGSVVPDGYLLCDGQAVSRADYAELFSVIGTTWGAGDGETTFNVPDMREVAPVGVGQSDRTEGAHDAFALGEFKDDQLQSHTHSYTGATTVISAGLYAGSNYNVNYPGRTTGANSGRSGTVTRGKRIGVNYIIKY